jgi:hypothetical protein
MCDVCGCAPCKCGREIKEKVCSGCKKPAKQCVCAPVKATEKVKS